MGTGIGQRDDGVWIGDQLCYFLLVEIHHGHAEAGLQVVGQRKIECQIDRILSDLGGGTGERHLLEFAG